MSRESPKNVAAAARKKGVSVETAPTLAQVTRSLAEGEAKACPDENTIAGLIGGVLEPAEIKRLGQHIDNCAPCAALVNELGAVLAPASEGDRDTPGSTSARTQPESPRTPKQLGRYQVLEPLGAGGMGIVTLAYDPRLKRNVALKLIRPELLASSAEPEMRARLLREAQALASLSHPNVVAVHDVGSWEDGLFIAMEYVAGSTVVAGPPRLDRSPAAAAQRLLLRSKAHPDRRVHLPRFLCQLRSLSRSRKILRKKLRRPVRPVVRSQ